MDCQLIINNKINKNKNVINTKNVNVCNNNNSNKTNKLYKFNKLKIFSINVNSIVSNVRRYNLLHYI